MEDNGGSDAFRLRELWRWRERFQDDHDKWRREVDLELRDFSHMAEEFAALKTSVEATRKTVQNFAYTVAGSCVVFALSVLVATGKVG